MELSERINNLLEYSKMNPSKFSNFVGFKTPQTVRALLSGATKSLSFEVATKIITKFPQISEDWLKTGEGEMLKSNYHQVVNGGEKVVQHGSINECPADGAGALMAQLSRCLDAVALSAQHSSEAVARCLDTVQRTMDAQTRLTDRLLDVLERLTDPQTPKN